MIGDWMGEEGQFSSIPEILIGIYFQWVWSDMMKRTSGQKRSKRIQSKNKKKQHRKRMSQALAAAGAIAGGTQAYAVPVRFENPAHGQPGHFHWVGPPNQQSLNIRQPVENQPTANDVGALVFDNVVQGVFTTLIPASITAIDVDDSSPYRFVNSLDAGQLIPESVANWNTDVGTPYGAVYYSGSGSNIPEGVATYLGVKFVSSGDHYGWIGVVRTGTELEAFAWGYETDAGVSIAAGGGSTPTGACCDDSTGNCSDGVPQSTCEGGGDRWGGVDSDCATIDPPCEPPPPAIGACCDRITGMCADNVTEDECNNHIVWTEDASCSTIACMFHQAIPAIGGIGLITTALGTLAAGVWVLRKRKPESDTDQK